MIINQDGMQHIADLLISKDEVITGLRLELDGCIEMLRAKDKEIEELKKGWLVDQASLKLYFEGYKELENKIADLKAKLEATENLNNNGYDKE